MVLGGAHQVLHDKSKLTRLVRAARPDLWFIHRGLFVGYSTSSPASQFEIEVGVGVGVGVRVRVGIVGVVGVGTGREPRGAAQAALSSSCTGPSLVRVLHRPVLCPPSSLLSAASLAIIAFRHAFLKQDCTRCPFQASIYQCLRSQKTIPASANPGSSPAELPPTD